MTRDFLPGDLVTIKSAYDSAVRCACDSNQAFKDKSFFLGKECFIVKRNKSGFYRVALVADSTKFENFPKHNLELVKGYQVNNTF